MHKIIITVESGSDMTQDLADKYNIYIVPMHVTFGTQTKDDGFFPAEEIPAFFDKTGQVPKTSGSTPQDFIKVFDEIHEKYPQASILHLAYSAVTTCSMQSAQIAAEKRDYVRFVDTKHVTVAQTAITLRVAKLIQAHPEWDVDRAAREAEKISAKMRMFFLPSNLSFLRAGGRVSNAAAIAGTLLKIRPMIEVVDGHLNATRKYRGNLEKVIARSISEYTENEKLSRDEVWIVYTPRFTQNLLDKTRQTLQGLGFKDIHLLHSGGVITTHGGPCAFGMAAFTD